MKADYEKKIVGLLGENQGKQKDLMDAYKAQIAELESKLRDC